MTTSQFIGIIILTIIFIHFIHECLLTICPANDKEQEIDDNNQINFLKDPKGIEIQPVITDNKPYDDSPNNGSSFQK